MSFSQIPFVFLFLFLILSSCGKGFNINSGKNKLVDQKLGAFLAESRPLEGDHLEQAKAGCGALLKQKDEIRPGFLYKFQLSSTSCQDPGIEVKQEVSARLDQEGGSRWYFRPEGGTPPKFLDQMVFDDVDPFSKICEQILKDGKSTISDTVMEGLSATQFKFSSAGHGFVFADVLTAYKNRPDEATSVKVHKKERFKIYLGESAGHSPLSTLSPAGTVTLRLRETLCGEAVGDKDNKNVAKMDRFEQILKSIQP